MNKNKLMGKFTNLLSENNYKLTSQRETILQVMVENQEQHFSAEELHQKVKEINPDVGLATVYRTLELFCQLGIAHRLDFDRNYKRYELNLEGHHHHHLICKNCGKIIEFNDSVLEKFETNLEREYKFEIHDHRIKFYGKCKDCQE